MKDTISFLFYLGLLFCVVGGYIANIVKLADAAGIAGLEVLRILGIFIFPLGSILGFIG